MSLTKEIRGFLVGIIITSTIIIGIPAFAANAPKPVNFAINAFKIAFNSKTVPLENITYKGSTYVKVSQASSLFGKTAVWEGKTRTVNIKDKITTPSAITVPQKTSAIAISKDAAKPQVKSAVAQVNGKAVDIVFTQKLDKTSAEDVSCYSLKGRYGKKTPVKVLSATLDAAGTKVTLSTEEQQVSILYDLDISNIKSEAGAEMAPYCTQIIGCNTEKEEEDPYEFCLVRYQRLSATSLKLIFNKNIEQNSAQNISNYLIIEDSDGMVGHYIISDDIESKITQNILKVSKAELCPEHNQVILTFSEPKADTTYFVRSINILDEHGHKCSYLSFFSLALNDTKDTYNLNGYGKTEGLRPGDESIPQDITMSEDRTTIMIRFSKKLNKEDAENLSNYALYNPTFDPMLYNVVTQVEKIPIYSATLDSSGTKVILKTPQLLGKKAYIVFIKEFKDASGNTIGGYMGAAGYYGLDNNIEYRDQGLHMLSATVLSPTTIKLKLDRIEKEIVTNPAKFKIKQAYTAKGQVAEIIDVIKAELGSEDNTVILTLAKPMSDIQYGIFLDAPFTKMVDFLVDSGSPIPSGQRKKEEVICYPSVCIFWGESEGFPEVVYAQSLTNNSMEIVFDDLMQKESTESVSNYKISSADGTKKLDIISAKLDDSGKKIVLATGDQENIDYNVTVSNVYSAYNMPLGDKTTGVFKGTAKPNDTKPEVVSFKVSESKNAIEIIFNQKVDQASAENALNYTFSVSDSTQSAIDISGITLSAINILSITLDATGTKVTIQTKDVLPVVFDLAIANIKNDAGLNMDPYSISVKEN
jgi:hypothetical protein